MSRTKLGIPRGQFSTGEKHGDFFPVCTNTTVEMTPYPEIPQKDTSMCSSSSEEWEQFLTTVVNFVHVVDKKKHLRTEPSLCIFVLLLLLLLLSTTAFCCFCCSQY